MHPAAARQRGPARRHGHLLALWCRNGTAEMTELELYGRLDGIDKCCHNRSMLVDKELVDSVPVAFSGRALAPAGLWIELLRIVRTLRACTNMQVSCVQAVASSRRVKEVGGSDARCMC
jgi:hypothetical protein